MLVPSFFAGPVGGLWVAIVSDGGALDMGALGGVREVASVSATFIFSWLSSAASCLTVGLPLKISYSRMSASGSPA